MEAGPAEVQVGQEVQPLRRAETKRHLLKAGSQAILALVSRTLARQRRRLTCTARAAAQWPMARTVRGQGGEGLGLLLGKKEDSFSAAARLNRGLTFWPLPQNGGLWQQKGQRVRAGSHEAELAWPWLLSFSNAS